MDAITLRFAETAHVLHPTPVLQLMCAELHPGIDHAALNGLMLSLKLQTNQNSYGITKEKGTSMRF